VNIDTDFTSTGVVCGGAKFNDNKSLIKYLKIFSSLGQVARRKNKFGLNPVTERIQY
jgi:hypothetical protein